MEQQSEQAKTGISGFLPVIAALSGNVFITAIKFVGYFISGSSALFSEAVHSLADTSNQILLMVGIKRSIKKSTEEYSYGFGQERFFWAVISACGVFFLGAGVTIYKGISALMIHREVEINVLAFFILGISFVIESITFILALKELRRNNIGKSTAEMLEEGDPSTIAVIYEDGVAVLGVLIALASIILTELTRSYYWDSIGSIAIGILLGIVAILLIRKNRTYLLKKSIPEELKDQIIDIIVSDPAIEKVIDFKSSVLDVDNYRIKCEVEFNGTALLKEFYKTKFLKQEYEDVKGNYQEFLKFCANYIDRVPRLMGRKINKIEEKIQKQIPEIKHIDIEIN